MRISPEDVSVMLTVAICGLLGVVSAIIVHQLYSRGIVIDELMTHFGVSSIVDVEVLIIILFIIVGIVVASVKKL